MRSTFVARLDSSSIDIKHLDITSYLSAPNRINTCNEHEEKVYRIFPNLSDMDWPTVQIRTLRRFFLDLSDTVWLSGQIGTVCRIFTDLFDMVWFTGIIGTAYNVFTCLGKRLALYHLSTHNMAKIVQAFDPATGQVYKDKQGQLKVQVVRDWPISAGLGGGKEYNEFFDWAKKFNNYHPDITNKSFRYSPIHYQTKIFEERVNSLSVFNQEEEEFLQCCLTLRQYPKFFETKELFSVVKDIKAQEEAEKTLQSFTIEEDTIICRDHSALQVLVPYVKRLLQLFPAMKDIRNRFYQCETNSCIGQMKQSPLDFNTDALNVKAFLENEGQVLQLQMVDGDEWTGLVKVYQVLQKNNFLIEGQYTVLKLERFLHKLMDFRTLMQSIKAPYLMLVACETNQLLKPETEGMIRTLFQTMKQKPFIKIILTTRSEERVNCFLQEMDRNIFGNGLVTRL
jgi:hypothetical protein